MRQFERARAAIAIALSRCSLEARGAWATALVYIDEQGRLSNGRSEPMTIDRLAHVGMQDVRRIRALSVELMEVGLLAIEGRWIVSPLLQPCVTQPEHWERTRDAVLARDRHTCCYCGEPGNTVDHVLPKSRGGTHGPENLVTACTRCNCTKSERTPEEAGMVLIFDWRDTG